MLHSRDSSVSRRRSPQKTSHGGTTPRDQSSNRKFLAVESARDGFRGRDSSKSPHKRDVSVDSQSTSHHSYSSRRPSRSSSDASRSPSPTYAKTPQPRPPPKLNLHIDTNLGKNQERNNSRVRNTGASSPTYKKQISIFTAKQSAISPNLSTVSPKSKSKRQKNQEPVPPSTPTRPATPVFLAQQQRTINTFKSLVQGTTELSNWTARFISNSITYPQPTQPFVPSLTAAARSARTASPTSGSIAQSPALQSPLTAVTPTTPLIEEPWRRIHACVAGGPTTKFPYNLSFTRLDALPIPAYIEESYLADPTKPLLLQLRVSLFDLETASFFGRTWIDPLEINLRESKSSSADSAEDDPEKRISSVVVDRESASEKKAKKPRSSKNSSSDTSHKDEGESTRDSESLKSKNSHESESQEGTESTSGSETSGSESDDSSSESNSDGSSASDLVEESADDNDPDLFKPEYVSAGWTYFHPFDPERQGIDVWKAWEYEEVYPEANADSNTPIFAGSPRILIFIAPLLMEYTVGYPALAPIPGSGLSFDFCTRPDLRQIAYLWRENAWISRGTDVPGLRFISSSEIKAIEDSIAVVSKIRISVFPSLSKFEDALLTEIAINHYNLFPESMTPDEQGNLPVPEIIERRIHIGLHNTQTFLSPPVITTLKPVYSEHVGGDGFECVFNGNLELEKYVDDPGIAFIFVVEYKVLMLTNNVEKKKTGLGAIIERLSGDKKEGGGFIGLEKIVPVGWGAWTPSSFNGANPQVIPLDTSVGPNPYSALVHSPTLVGDENEYNEDWLDYAFQMGRLATNEYPIVLSFCFFDSLSPESPGGNVSPARDRIDEEDEEDEAPTPKRPQTPPPLPKKENDDDDSDNMEDLNMSHQIQAIDPSQFPKPSKYKGRRGGTLTRGERARLLSAGFFVPLDDNGMKPHQLTLTPGELTSGVQVDLEAEAKDFFRNNELSFTLMGISFTPELCTRLTGHFPSSVYFTYQFYNFPYCSTDRMYIYNGPMPPGNSHHDVQHQRSFSMPTHQPHARHWSHASNSSFHSQNQQGEKTHDANLFYWPGILYPINDDGSVVYGPAGLSRTYLIENDIDSCSTISTFSKHVPDIVQYLNQKSLHIDVWDGDSLLHLGAAVVELKPALRQGRSGVLYDDDVDIVFTEYINSTPIARSASHTSDMSSILTASASGGPEKSSRSIVIGQLHIRLVNIGRSTESPDGLDLQQQQHQHQLKLGIQSKRRDPYCKESVIVRDHRHRIHLRPETIEMPLKLVDVDSELAQMLSTAYEERVRSRKKANRNHGRDDDEYLHAVDERRRKLERVKRVLERNHQTDALLVDGAAPYHYNLTRQERQRDLDTIDVFRERRKPALIERKLAEQITVTHTINASFGQAHYFEYIFTNPYNEDSTFEILWDDDELRWEKKLVTSASEWKYLRRIHSIRVGVEDKLISVRSNGTPEIYTLANEAVSIPFVYQSFLGGTISNASENEASVVGLRRLCGNESVPGGGIHPRRINVSFMNSRRMPIAMIDVVIKPKNYAIDRVLRFFRSEGELLRQTIKFYLNTIASGENSGDKKEGKPSNAGGGRLVTENSTVYDAANPWKKYVRCNNSEVVCNLADSGKGQGNLKEIFFKYRIGNAPETTAIYFLLYDDPFHTSLHEVWRVFVHSLHRLDVNCILGQTTQTSLVLRGSSFSRTIQCYSNLPDELLVTASAPFILTANSLNEIGVYVRPKQEHTRDVIVNVVDVDDQSLVSSWLVVSHCSIPTITKSFEATVPRGKSVNKRVSYTNPYKSRREFRLKTNAEHLVQFREGSVLRLEGGGTQYIALRLLPNATSSGMADVLIFVNNERDQIEECVRIRVTYSE
ncbi:Nephrocystin-4 [Entophlyctis sp. JEL0112]|nr:Nephrocystin-4 [Entophlyctis sp. JEL0112]